MKTEKFSEKYQHFCENMKFYTYGLSPPKINYVAKSKKKINK